MSRIIKAAAVQMDAKPAPVAERLKRAEKMLTKLAKAGAQLVVLPELFNTGYEYSDANYTLAEPLDGATVTWMKAQAAKRGFHLAGSLLLLDGEEVYNSLLLVSPEGKVWRYDKNFPWAWERAYFREGRRTTIAETTLGKFGLLICWDYAHPELWARYAGKVDAMIVASCPPKMTECEVIFPGGERYNTADGPKTYTGDDIPFGTDMNIQSSWLRVPLISTTGTGIFESRMPLAHLSLAGLLATEPHLWKYLPEAPETRLTCGFYPQTKIVDAQGNILGQVTQDGDQFVVAEIELAETPPRPITYQPKSSFAPYAYFTSDWLTPSLMTWLYRRGYRRQLGRQMAPIDHATKVWAVVVAAALVVGGMIGLTIGKGSSRK